MSNPSVLPLTRATYKFVAGLRLNLARTLRGIANRLDTRSPRISVVLTADVASYVAGMKRAQGSTDA